jgi:hypothetical protein
VSYRHLIELKCDSCRDTRIVNQLPDNWFKVRVSINQGHGSSVEVMICPNCFSPLKPLLDRAVKHIYPNGEVICEKSKQDSY